jgi:DNA-binding CsgD family transcriptional regulator
MVYLFPYAGDDRRSSVRGSSAKNQKKELKVEKKRVDDKIVVPIKNHNSEIMPIPMPGSMWKIMKEVCERHGCQPSELAGSGREYRIIFARREYCLRVRKETKYSLSHIAKTIKKDHTTVMHAIKLASKGPEYYQPFKKLRPVSTTYEPYNKIFEREYKIEFTDRDKRVFKYMLEGMRNDEIADALGSTSRQAREYRYQVNCKLKRMETMKETKND